MVSFTTEIKNEISLVRLSDMEEMVLLSSFVRNNARYDKKEIVFTIENLKIVRKIVSLFKDLFDINPEVNQINKINSRKNTYAIKITDKVVKILFDLFVVDEKFKFINRVKPYFVESEDLKRAYLRGLFLACGSINDPKKPGYHLEFLVDFKEESDFILELFDSFLIPAKSIVRDKGYMIYIKEAEKIGDFLRIISANNAVLYYEDIRIYRDLKNMNNRLNNCEQANVDKIVNAANNQIKEIDFILNTIGYEAVEDKLLEVMDYRKKYSDVSLSELAEIITVETGKVISKSGLNHRLRKIHEIAERLRNNK